MALYNIQQQQKEYATTSPGFLDSLWGGIKKVGLGTLDLLSRPNYAVANAANSLVTGRDNPLSAAWKGFSGQQKTTFSDVLGSLGMREGFGRGALGFGLDIALDPTTYLTLGTSAAAKSAKVGNLALNKAGRKALMGMKATGIADDVARQTLLKQIESSPATLNKLVDRGGVKMFGKSIMPADKIANSLLGKSTAAVGKGLKYGTETGFKPLDKFTAGTSRFIDSVAPAFSKKYVPSYADPKRWNKLTGAEETFGNLLSAGQTTAKQNAVDVAKIYNKLSPQKQREALDIIQAGFKSGDQSVMGVANKAMKSLDADTALKKALGKNIITQDNYGYLPNIFKQSDVDKRISGLRTMMGGSQQFAEDTKNSLHRTVLKFVDQSGNTKFGTAKALGLTEANANDITKGIRALSAGDTVKINMLPNIFKDGSGKFYKTFQPTVNELADAGFDVSKNLGEMVGVSRLSASKARAGREFSSMVKELGYKEGGKGLEQITSEALPELKGLWFRPEEKMFIEKTLDSITNQKEIKSFVKWFDKTNNWWKAYALLSPGYHTRNVIGNFFNNFVGGISNPQYYNEARKVQTAYGKFLKNGIDDVIEFGGEKLPISQIAKRLQENGLMGTGFYRDIAEDLAKATEKSNLWLGRKNWFLRKSQDVGTFLEDNAKIAHVVGRMNQGATLTDAVKSAKKYLFDYNDLTTFEKGLKRVMPFYTWSRKNIPLQISEALKQPGKYAWIKKLSDESQAQFGQIEDPYNNFSIPIAYGNKNGNTQYFDLQSFLPAADIARGMNAGDTILSSISPLIKTPVEQVTNYSFFTGQPIERYPGEPVNEYGYPFSRKTAAVLNNFRPFADINRLNPGGVFGVRSGELPQGERALRYFTGLRGYEYNPEVSAQYKELDYNKMVSQINTNLRNAIKVGDWTTAKALYQQLQEVGGNESKTTQGVLTPALRQLLK